MDGRRSQDRRNVGSGTGPVRFLGSALAWIVILGAALVLVVAVLVPRLGGATPYTILTGSMQPELPPGTLVVVRPTPIDDIAIGDVVTYQLRPGEPAMATHRVVSIGMHPEAGTVLQTQGDANDVPDLQWVREEQVRGRLWYSAPYLGHVNDLLTGSQRQLAVYLAAGLLLGYAALMFAASIRGRRPSGDGEPEVLAHG